MKTILFAIAALFTINAHAAHPEQFKMQDGSVKTIQVFDKADYSIVIPTNMNGPAVNCSLGAASDAYSDLKIAKRADVVAIWECHYAATGKVFYQAVQLSSKKSK